MERKNLNSIDLMIIGAQKAGTTSLKNYLNEHPEILGHPQTEFSYFTDDDLFTAKEFESIFDSYFTSGNKGKARAIVAKNVKLCESEIGLSRLRKHNPDCKVLFIIREPVSRAYSSYCMEVFNGWLKVDFSEIERIIKNKEFDNGLYKIFVRSGFYSEHLDKVYKYFSEDQVKIMLFEDLKKNPQATCQEIFDWIGLSPFSPNTDLRYNQSRIQRSKVITYLMSTIKNNKSLKNTLKSIFPYWAFTKARNSLENFNRSKKTPPKIPEKTKFYLYQHFKPYNEKLEKMTGLDLSNWKYEN